MKKVAGTFVIVVSLTGCIVQPQAIHPTDSVVRTITETDAYGRTVTRRDEQVESHETPRYNQGYGHPSYYGQRPIIMSPIVPLLQQNMYGRQPIPFYGPGGGNSFGGSASFNFR